MGDTYRRSVKIFIGGLSFETTDEALKRYFEQFGQVSDAIVMKDAVSRRSRGFGFITYMSSASVDEALSVKQHIVDNRRVEAKRAVPRSEVPTKVEPQLTQSPSLQPQTAWDAPFGMENYVLRGVGPEGRTRSNSTVSAGSMGGLMALDGVPMASKIFVGGLHYETRDASLQTYFEQFGPVQTAEVMFNRETHKSRGFGFVVFELEESANAVLQSTHHTVNGKVVEVKRAVPRAQSSTGGSNPSSPAMMGYPPSPSALGPGVCATALGKSASAAASKRPQRPRAPRDAMAASSNGAVAPGASPQRQRYPPPTTSYAAALRYGAGRQQTAGMPSHGGGKPPQHHGHMQGREDVGSFRLHSAHSNFLPPSATARAEAAAAHAFVQELKAWDVENPGQVFTFEESFDYYNEQQQQQQRGAPRDFAAHTAMGGGNGNFDASIPGAGGWQGPGPGSGLSPRAAWPQQAGQGGLSRQQQQSQRPPGDVSRVLAHNRMDIISPRHAGHFSTFPCHEDGGGVVGPDGGVDPHSHSYRSASGLNGLNLNGDDYHNGHGQNPLGEAQNGRLLSPGEAGGTPALMGSSPLLGDSGILETAFAELKLDGSRPLAMNPSLADGPVPNGDGPSLLNGIGGGGPPSASSEVLPYGRTGGETALDGGGGADGLAGSGVWRADAFGSALGVNVASTASEMGSGMRGVMSERKDIIGGGLGEHFMATLGGAEGATTQVNMGWH